MDTVYGTKKYFQSLGDNDYYNRQHSSSTNRVMQAACSSYQNTLGRHSTIGPYSHLSGNPYTNNAGCNNDFSYTNQYGYNSWGMWRDSRNLTPSSTYSSKSRSSIKSFTIILMTAAFIVILAVLSVAALAFYFSTFKSDDSIMIFDGKFQVTRGDVFTTGLKYNHTSVYQQKVDYYRNLISDSLERNGLTVYKCDIHGFGTGPLVQVDFRVFLDMRKVPRTIRSVEEHIRDSILKEIMSMKSAKGIQIDLSTLEIKRSLDTEVLNSASFVRERVTTPSSIMFDDKSRKAPSSTLISRPSSKATTSKPKPKLDIVEAEIDIENAPILQGSFEVTKTDADITEKKVRTSTLKPFTITNGSVRMKPKKTTIEKVKPLAKVPENLTANILKLENVTKPFQYERVTTPRAPTTTEEIPTITMEMEMEIHTSSEAASTTTKIPIPSSTVSIPRIETSSTTTSTTTTEANIPSVVYPSEAPPPKRPIGDLVSLEGEIVSQTRKKNATSFPSTIVLDDQPWLPIQPNVKIDHNLNDAKKKIHNAVNPPVVPSSYNTDPVGVQLLPRNKVRNPISNTVQKTNRPPIYHSFNNPALMYGPHEVEKLGLGAGLKPYPIPVDLIGEQSSKRDDSFLNKGEVLPSIKESPKIETTTVKMTTTPVYEKALEHNKTNESITLNIEETTDRIKNKTELGIDDEVTNQQVGEILLDLLKDSNVKLNETDSDDMIMQSRTDELELPEPKEPEVKNQTAKLNTTEESETESFDEIATVLSSMETLSFKNIKDYIMATTKSITKDILSTSTERDQTTARREKPPNVIDPMVKSDRISLIAPTTPFSVPKTATPKATPTKTSSTTSNPVSYDSESEPATASYVEVETVQYTPGAAAATWTPGLFPVQSKWEYVNGTLVYPSVAPMRKIYNETLQAWIIENPIEATERLPPTELVRNTSEPIKNISAIFDTLASKLNMNTMETAKLPPFMSHFSNKLKIEQQKDHPSIADYLKSTTKRPVQTTTTTLPPSSSAATPEDELPILLSQNTESYYGSSAETLIGEAEVEEVDPTQYEQMLLIDRVSAQLRPSSTAPSLVTLMPVKSNSGIRPGFLNSKGSARGFPPSGPSSSSSSSSQSTSNRRRFEDASFVVRTSMNIST
ncbi:mucin-2 [Sitodiplosis mosellana]|uniref:mucin-2 n=1 Tax=Sitodiplosis mosellana TaxID=263140 RepID=UPI0024441C96|nr:mucin-2 [Sitodiplosis mosellana]